MVLAAVCGLIAIVLMFLNRIKMLFRAFRACGLTPDAARDGFHAMVADAKARPGSYLLGVAIFCAFAFFGEYILLGLVALGTLATAITGATTCVDCFSRSPRTFETSLGSAEQMKWTGCPGASDGRPSFAW